MHHEPAPGLQLPPVQPKRLPRQQVHRDRIRAERVQHDHVRLPVRLRRHPQPRVPLHDPRHSRRAIRQVREPTPVRRHPDHRRVDLEEGQRIPRPAIRGNGAHPQADQAHPKAALALPRPQRLEHLSQRPLPMVVRERLPAPRRVQELPPMNGVAVHQLMETPRPVARHPRDPEEVPERQLLPAPSRLQPEPGGKHRQHRDRKADRPLPLGPARHGRRAHQRVVPLHLPSLEGPRRHPPQHQQDSAHQHARGRVPPTQSLARAVPAPL